MQDYRVIPVTIGTGMALTAPIDLERMSLCRIVTPGTLTGTAFTFQFSEDGANWQNLYDATGTEKSVTVAADRAVYLDPTQYLGIRYMKVRSGTAGTPTPEAGQRTILLVVRELW